MSLFINSINKERTFTSTAATTTTTTPTATFSNQTKYGTLRRNEHDYW
jgi:hypothetical protein